MFGSIYLLCVLLYQCAVLRDRCWFCCSVMTATVINEHYYYYYYYYYTCVLQSGDRMSITLDVWNRHRLRGWFKARAPMVKIMWVISTHQHQHHHHHRRRNLPPVCNFLGFRDALMQMLTLYWDAKFNV